MKTKNLDQLRIVGIAVRTINAPTKAEQAIPALWRKFMAESPGVQLSTKLSEDIYCVYCEYEGDHTAPYTCLIGYSVPIDSPLPEGMTAIDISPNNYVVFKAEGDLTAGAVFKTWSEIWNSSINRTYAADFEVYGNEAMNPKDGKIDIFVGIE
jgi:predicted transcriptional regulator YdeE